MDSIFMLLLLAALLACPLLMWRMMKMNSRNSSRPHDEP